MARDGASNPVHRLSTLLLWIVLAILTASAAYSTWIAIVNWKHIGV